MENHRLVHPQHLNHHGSLFGGQLLMWVDEFAFLAASLEFPEARFVTVGLDQVAFRHGVHEGAILRFHSRRVASGTTSVTYEVEVETAGRAIFSTRVTLVAIDEAGEKTALSGRGGAPKPMKLQHEIDLGYCTNIHRGETWEETFASLRDYALRVREEVAPGQPYGIGLRLGHGAAVELSSGAAMAEFRRWLDANDCYVFTINGFPYGQFHATRVKEEVYRPDWTTPERLEYTKLLFDLLVEMLPEGAEGSVSTLPGSFKEFAIGDEGLEQIFANLAACREHIEALQDRSGHRLHLGLEPEPLGLFETSGESLQFFGHLVERAGMGVLETIGINYDTCHLAIEFEEPGVALAALTGAGIKISKLHLSSALALEPTPENRARLASFGDDVYLHQVVAKEGEHLPLRRVRDLPEALALAESGELGGDEWRVHFHIPLHAAPGEGFASTQDHLLGALDWLAQDPGACRHLEMETYTWEVLPEELRSGDVVDQLAREYRWTLAAMKERGLA